MGVLDGIGNAIEGTDSSFGERARERQRRLTKPPGSLGRLESMAARLTAIQRTDHPRTFGRRVVIFAADHGVTDEGVSSYPSEVTGQMVANFLAGGAAINALAKVAEAEIVVVDCGVEHPPQPPGEEIAFRRRSVRPGARNLAREPAMTEEELSEALRIGIDEARRAHEDGIAVVGLGEMGIGNTTPASAIAAALTGAPVHRVTGPGAGLDDYGVRRKAEVIERALELHELPRKNDLETLRRVGGLELAATVGFCLEAAARRLAVIVDGFITTAAFAVASRLSSRLQDYAFFSHRSAEPGHRVLLDFLGAEPLLDLQLRLGEGTGAALAMPILGAAAAAHNEMATFESAGVSEKK